MSDQIGNQPFSYPHKATDGARLMAWSNTVHASSSETGSPQPVQAYRVQERRQPYKTKSQRNKEAKKKKAGFKRRFAARKKKGEEEEKKNAEEAAKKRAAAEPQPISPMQRPGRRARLHTQPKQPFPQQRPPFTRSKKRLAEAPRGHPSTAAAAPCCGEGPNRARPRAAGEGPIGSERAGVGGFWDPWFQEKRGIWGSTLANP